MNGEDEMEKSIKQAVIIAAAIVSLLFITSCKLDRLPIQVQKLMKKMKSFLKRKTKAEKYSGCSSLLMNTKLCR